MTNTSTQIHGTCDPRFAEVGAEFERNFRERDELGAAVAVFHEGKPVVDLWAGIADESTGRAWERDSMAVVFSVSKGLAAICMHMLIDRGELDPAAPVARYWPEFAANGKEKATVAMALSHQIGLPYWQEPLPEGALLDSELVTARLAQEAPVWVPGTQHGYHAMTIGFIEGEILRRITGKTIGRFLREEVAEPLGADVWIGLPEAEEHRVAPIVPGAPNPASPFFQKLMAEPEWPAWKIMTNSGNDNAPESINSRARHAAEIPAVGGIVSARGLARAYAPLSLDGSVDGVRLVHETALPAMRSTRSASGIDSILQIPSTFTLGFSKTWGDRKLGSGEHVILGEHAFGAPGLGGSIGFADGQAAMSFGYIMNRHGGGVGLTDRGQSLVDAAYRAVGFTSSKPGFWIK